MVFEKASLIMASESSRKGRFMSAEDNQPRSGRGALKSRRSGIWSEIDYLDSETSYREYLSVADRSAKSRSELIMTDDAGSSIANTVFAAFLVVFVAFLFIVLLTRVFHL
jgi:hypothetical protein